MCYNFLPEGYTCFDKIDLQNNKKQFILVNVLSVVLLTVVAATGCFIESPAVFLEGDLIYGKLIPATVLCVSIILYIVLHEAVHGIFMYAFCKSHLRFGYKVIYAYAGSDAYYDKLRYIIIALGPLVIWGIVFAVLTVFIHSGVWFWVIWLLQVTNVSGAAGDLFCTFKMFKYPGDILVQDTGTEMTVYSRKKSEEKVD